MIITAGIQILVGVFILLPMLAIAFMFAYAVFGAWAIPLTLALLALSIMVAIGNYAQKHGY